MEFRPHPDESAGLAGERPEPRRSRLEHALQHFAHRRPVRDVIPAVDIHDEDASVAGVIGADGRDVRTIPVAGEYALIEIDQGYVFARTLVGGEDAAQPRKA